MVPPSETESLAVIRQNAPAIARAIAADKELRTVVGAEKWPLALHRLAEFSKKTDADHKDALRIIGDTVTRVKSPIATINLDGDPSEWSKPMPDLPYMRPAKGPEADVWKNGAAALVRQDRLYLMAGIADAAQYFAQPGNQLRLTIDCKGDQAWDARLSLTWQNGAWMVRQIPFGAGGREGKLLPAAQGTVQTVAEVGIAIRDFVSVADAKPIWALLMEARNKYPKGKPRWLQIKQIAVFNENAREGVAAWPYVRNFLCLCADKPLDDFELTAVAIAITSSTMYLDSDDEVRAKLRADNTAFLELARELDAWQAQIKAEYRLKDYPLEAQLAWAARIKHEGAPAEFLEGSRTLEKRNNVENYYWVSTSIDTFRKLKAVAVKEGLADPSLAKCSARIEKWAGANKEGTFDPGSYRGMAEKAEEAGDTKKAEKARAKEARAREIKDNAGTVGSFRGKPVSAFRIKHTESMLKQIEARGHFIGSCGQHTHMCMSMMQALGIAPTSFYVLPTQEGKGDHIWPARFDPSQNVWRSYQVGRGGPDLLFFILPRPPVFTYAAEVGAHPMDRRNLGPRPFPTAFCRTLPRFDVKKISHTGIPTKEIREWMLTPGF